MDMYIQYKILIRPEDLRNVAITCHCKTRTVYEVPEPIQRIELPLVLQCPKCYQNYGIVGTKILRLDKDHVPETGHNLLQKATPSVMNSDDVLDGKVISPGNDQVN